MTFDDGFLSVSEHALSGLARRGWSAIVFLIAAAVGKTDDWDVRLLGRQRAMMDWPEIQHWSRAGFEFGSHTLNHPDLTALSDRALKHELEDSRFLIEDRLGCRVRYLSYPFGRHDARVRDAARRAGYDAAFTTGTRIARLEGERCDDRFAIPRVLIHGLTSLFEFRALLAVAQGHDSDPAGWPGRRRNCFLTSLSAGSATVSNWRRKRRRLWGEQTSVEPPIQSRKDMT